MTTDATSAAPPAPDVSAPDDPAAIARRFVDARRAARALSGFPGPQPTTLQQGYAVQEEAIALWPEPVAGWKLGRIAPPLDARLGAGRLSGPIFPGAIWTGGEGVVDLPVISGGFAAVEAEYVLRIGRAPEPGRTYTAEEAAELVDAMLIGVELAGSPLATINDLGPTVVASDFGNNGGLVVGAEIAGWRDRALDSLRCETWIEGRCVGRGGAANIPDGPLDSLRALLENLSARGRTLKPGDLISTGAATGVHDIVAGQEAEARFGGDGVIRVRAVPAEPR